MPPHPGHMLPLPLPICPRPSSTDTSLCSSFWGWSATKSCFVGEPPWTPMPQSAELQKATCTCLLWAHVPWVLTSQPARLSDRLPALDMSKNIYYSFFSSGLNYFSKKLLWLVLQFKCSFHWILWYNSSCQRLFFASAESRGIFMMELSWVETNRRREQGPIGKKKKKSVNSPGTAKQKWMGQLTLSAWTEQSAMCGTDSPSVPQHREASHLPEHK